MRTTNHMIRKGDAQERQSTHLKALFRARTSGPRVAAGGGHWPQGHREPLRARQASTAVVIQDTQRTS